MTNTLHRMGSPEELRGDYVIFATTAIGYNKEGSAEKKREFLRIALKHDPVNLGSVGQGNIFKSDPERIISGVKDGSGVAAVFKDMESVRGMVEDLLKADLGISINISGLLHEVKECCRGLGFHRHSVEHSLGIMGRKDKIPEERVLRIHTMCGHGMVSFNFIRKMINEVKLGRLSPSRAAAYLAGACECGAFNPSRGAELLEEVKDMG